MAGNRLGVLDGMRGIAILLVVWFHIWQISWLPAPAPWLQFIPETGFIGVSIFFFISGFVICYPFVRAHIEGGPRPSWGHFAYRRALKIVPSYLLSIAIVYLIGYEHVEQSGGVFRDLLTHLLFVHNWFATTYGSINGVLWTLAVEVQFYCAFPLISLAFLRWPYMTVAAMMALALAFRIYVQGCCDYYFEQLIEQLPGYLDFFACGMLAAWIYVSLRNKRVEKASVRTAAAVAAIAGFAILIALMESLFNIRYAPKGFANWQVVNRTWLALDCALIGVASLLAAPYWKAVLENPILVFCSVISYNWYIYHQIVARELWWAHLPPWQGADMHFDHQWQFWYSIAAFPATLIVAAAVTYGFERPILLKSQWWRRQRFKFV